MNVYAKFLAQIAVTVISAIIAALASGPVTLAAWINVVIIGLGAVAVLGAGNLPAGVWRYTKSIVSAATAAAVVIQTAAQSDFSTATWLQVAVAALGALGVFAVPGPVVAPVAAPLAGRHEAI
jgi:hypothetical protein